MVAPINPVSLNLIGQVQNAAPSTVASGANMLPTNPFDQILSKAIDALAGASKEEIKANQLVDKYIQGQAELSDVMLQTAKMGIAVQLATTTVTTAVNTFKEITSMQI